MLGGDILGRSDRGAVGIKNTDNDIDQIRIIDLLPHPTPGDPYKIDIIFFEQNGSCALPSAMSIRSASQ